MSIKCSSSSPSEAEENGENSPKSAAKRAKIFYPATLSGQMIEETPGARGADADDDVGGAVVESVRCLRSIVCCTLESGIKWN